jgi:hypothetical protein
MTFSHGAVEIRRASKIDEETGIVLSIYMLLVTPEIVDIWQSRTEVAGESATMVVPSD